MFRKLGHALLITALVAVLGGHWAVLQTVAWTNMLADNLRVHSLETALVKTFSGKQPCGLCREISAGRKAEKQTEFTSVLQKLEFVAVRAVFVFASPTDFYLQSERAFSPEPLADQPPVPPPRPLTA